MRTLRWITVCLLACALSAAWGQTKATDPLFPIMNDEMLWGYIDHTGKVVIQPQFDGADYYSEGLAPVKVGYGSAARYGFIDKAGEMVIKPQFRDVRGFSEGLAAVRTTAWDWGFIDKIGKFALKPAYWSANDFRNGQAVVATDPDDPESPCEKLLCIDRAGKVIATTQVCGEGFQTFGVIGRLGKLQMGRNPIQCLDFHEGLAMVPAMDSGLTGFVDPQGTVVIKPRYERALDFSEGLAAVSTGERWGYIDKTGKTAIQAEYDGAESFSEGLAQVSISSDDDNIPTLDGGSWYRSTTGRFIDKNGKVVLDLSEYHGAESFRDSLARVWIVARELGGGPSYIDKTGKFIWKDE